MADAKGMAGKIMAEAALAVRRIARSDFQREHATERERELLAAAEPPVAAAIAQDYVAWRRSLLVLAALLLGVALLLNMIGFQTTATSRAEMFGATEGEIERLIPNVEILDQSAYCEMLASLIALVLVVRAGRGWRQVRRSIRAARIAWIVSVGTPLVLAVVPWAKLLEFAPGNPEAANAVRGVLGVLLGFGVFLFTAPKVLAVFPGLVRTSMALKTLLPESAAVSYVALIFTPVYAAVLLVVFSTISQLGGDAVLVVGLVCLLAGSGVYLLKAKTLSRAHSEADARTVVGSVRRTALVFNLAGGVLLGIYLLTNQIDADPRQRDPVLHPRRRQPAADDGRGGRLHPGAPVAGARPDARVSRVAARGAVRREDLGSGRGHGHRGRGR